MGLKEEPPPSYTEDNYLKGMDIDLDINLDSMSTVYNEASLRRRLKFLKEELEIISRRLFDELVLRKEQLQFEHRVILLGILRRHRSLEDMEEIYKKDSAIIEINRFICDIANKLDALSEIAWTNRGRYADVEL
jgi:hypothetical protein